MKKMYYGKDSPRSMHAVLASMLIIGTLLLGVSSAGTVSYQNVTSVVAVSKAVAIGMSPTLFTDGINFSMLDPDSVNNNASDNYNGTNQTSYWVSVDNDSTSNADICVKANASLTSGANVIENYDNYTLSDSQYNNATLPAAYGWNITTAYNKTTYGNIPPGGRSYFRFWLDIPAGQAPGTYSNTVSFKGIVKD